MTANAKRVEQSETAELHGASKELNLEHPASSLVEVDFGAESHIGSVRRDNQDHYLVIRADRSLQSVLSNLPAGALPSSVEETAYGMVVADGLGGMPEGGLASSMALRKLVDLVAKTPDWVMRMNRRKAVTVKRRVIQRFQQIDKALREHGARDPRLAGMGTTLTATVSLGADLFVGHIGDSRAYLLRGDTLHQLTRDDTLAEAMIEAGVAREEDEKVKGMRRVLTAALGSTANPSDPDVQHLNLHNGDQLMLCTDGLTESVDNETIGSILRGAKSAEVACRALIDAALRAGGDDNITVVLARYNFPTQTTP